MSYASADLEFPDEEKVEEPPSGQIPITPDVIILAPSDTKEEKLEMNPLMTDVHGTLAKMKAGEEGQVPESGCLMSYMISTQDKIDTFLEKKKTVIKNMAYLLLLVLYGAYFTWAVVHNARQATALIVMTSLTFFYCVYSIAYRICGKGVESHILRPLNNVYNKHWNKLKWGVYLFMMVGLLTYLAMDVQPQPKQLISLAGIVTFLGFLFIFSKHPSQVNLRPVLWGLGIQFLLGILILRTSWGYASFQFLGAQVRTFLSYTDRGSEFLFGSNYKDHLFAFKILPVVIFFSCFISMLYHLGVIQGIISKIAWLMTLTMTTSPTESLIAAANIFIGQTEAPLLVKPFIADMTRSELHAMMTSGFATIAGTVLAAYMSFGISPEHLLCASVMNAPVALAVSKLFYPETQTPKVIDLNSKTDDDERSRSLLEAASAGASSSIKLVANIAANLIAFLALLAFANAVLAWAGAMVGYPLFSFQMVCSWLFTPVAFLMGVEWKDCGLVAELLGMKTFLNEFVAYTKLAKLISNRKQCIHPQISIRSETICTYALCGFANVSSVGMQLGGLIPLAPARKQDLAKIVMRALLAGTIACFITACVAGVLTVELPAADLCTSINSSLTFNSTSITQFNATDGPSSNMTYSHILTTGL